MTERRAESVFLTEYFGRLNGCGLRYAVMRNYDGLPAANLGEDVDVLIDPAEVPRHLLLIEKLASELGWKIILRLRRPYVYVVRLVRRVQDSNPWPSLKPVAPSRCS